MNSSSRKDLRQLFVEGAVWLGESTEQLFHLPSSTKRSSAVRTAPFGISAIDSSLPNGGLSFGTLHEWFAEDALTSKNNQQWCAPLHILSFLTGNATRRSHFSVQSSQLLHEQERLLILWIGNHCWPSQTLLDQTLPQWEERCIFIDPQKRRENFLVELVMQILRSPVVLAVICDGTRMDMATSRRLQFTARQFGALLFLVRPPWERGLPSAAQTRWMVSPYAHPSASEGRFSTVLSPYTTTPRWTLELFRSPGLVAPTQWILEWHEDEDETGSLRLSSESPLRAYEQEAHVGAEYGRTSHAGG